METSSENVPWLEGIDGDSLPHLIANNDRIIRVVAGPGSGKTTGSKRRVMRLIQGDGVQPGKIFVGTFTRAIANDLASALGVSVTTDEFAEEKVDVEVSTLHALALRLLRKFPTARPGRNLRFLLEFEKESMLYDIGEVLSKYAKQYERKRELKRVCAAWAEGTNLDISGFVGEMDRWLRRHGGMLIDEVVQFARIGLESGDIPAGPYDHVIIDEYQDLTAAEQKLVEKIWSGNGSLVVLGDDDQSIYSFRFNHPRGIQEFADRWKDKSLIDLSIPDNRRCGRNIVELANAMMASAGSKKSPMIAKKSEEGELSVIYWPSMDREIWGLARYMKTKKDKNFLVLVPRRFLGYRLKEAVGEDAQTSFHEEVLEIPIVQSRFAIAELFSNPKDRVALRALLSFHLNGIDYGPKRNAEAYLSIVPSDDGIKTLEDIANGDLKISGSGSKRTQEHVRNLLKFFQEHKNNQNLEQVIKEIFNPELANPVLDSEKKEKAKQDLIKLREAAIELLGEANDNSFSKILDHLRYRIAMRIPLLKEPEARVRIMTLHGAKGLEADIVIVAGVADQIIPGIEYGSPEDAEIIREEQRRLLYVSVTRAKQELVISWPQCMTYQDAKKNKVRIDQVWRRGEGDKIIKLGRTSLLPDIPQQPLTGARWLKTKV